MVITKNKWTVVNADLGTRSEIPPYPVDGNAQLVRWWVLVHAGRWWVTLLLEDLLRIIYAFLLATLMGINIILRFCVQF
jgi:hypothetical protein